MRQLYVNMTLIAVVIFIVPLTLLAEPVNTSWKFSAENLYDTGFIHMLMKNPDGDVQLFDMVLIENDSPGAGNSEKGVWLDSVWGENRARKIFYLDDPRSHKAYLILYNRSQGKYPLSFTVNGHISQFEKWNTPTYYMHYFWVEFPVEWLKKGENVVDLFCPEAKTEEDGWVLYLSRADEFVAGGGDPSDVGKTSFKSTDGGENWKESPFGPLGNDRAEYTIRLSFDRYVKTGWIESPVIDLWKEYPDDFIIRQHTTQKLEVSLFSNVPPGTAVDFYIRGGTNPSPFSDEWNPYKFVGSGSKVSFFADIKFNRRFLQFKAVLVSENPLVSPVVKNALINVELDEPYPIPNHDNINVVELYNPEIKYSSIKWEWEKWERPEFEELKIRENLDDVIFGSRSQFEAQVKLLDYASNRWRWHSPIPEYPEWDALSISKRINKNGGGGMCIQHNNFLGGLCMAYGWQGRLLNVDGHEVCEVWNDEFAKWIYIDASHNHYLVDKARNEPLSFLDIHKKYLDYFFPDKPIDWTNSDGKWFKKRNFEITDGESNIRRGSLVHHSETTLAGFASGSFVRMVPRNNWYEKPYPRPLSHGSSSWPWDGYINWYDEQTPRKKQYSWHTDRPRDMWPDLNTVYIHASSGESNDRLFLEFETYTPNFCHYEVNVNDSGWKRAGAYWTWLLCSGKNTLLVRSVNKFGVGGKPSRAVLNHSNVR
jgi:hypothetical protein